MERLTERDEYGNADIIGVDSADLQLNLEFDELNKVTDALNKLAEYEDKIERGELVEVVRCKDCKLYTDNINDDNLRNGYCTRLRHYNFDTRRTDDYCSYGERSVENV